jgi:hypothetical protein
LAVRGLQRLDAGAEFEDAKVADTIRVVFKDGPLLLGSPMLPAHAATPTNRRAVVWEQPRRSAMAR